jgi:hypothetical protein
MHIFYRGLAITYRTYLDNECGGAFMNITASNAYVLLDVLLLEIKITESLEKCEVSEEAFDDRYGILTYIVEKRK